MATLMLLFAGCSESSVERPEPTGQLLIGTAETDVPPIDARDLVGTLDVASGLHQILPLNEVDRISSARWRPDGGAVLVQALVDLELLSDGTLPSLYVVSMDHVSLEQLEWVEPGDSAPDWGPTCDSIVVRRDSSLWQLAIDGSSADELVALSGTLTQPDWSGDGSRLTFERRLDGVNEIWVVGADGTDPVVLVDEAHGQGDGPRISPNGDQVVFMRNVEHDDGHMAVQLFVQDLGGTEVRQLSDDPDGAYEPVWSPDGEWIAFSDGYGWIKVIRPDGTDRRGLGTRGILFDWGPVTGACDVSTVS